MFRVVTIVVAVIVASTNAQKRCCVPDQFTIEKYSTTGTVIENVPGPLAIIEQGIVAFDFTNNRVAEHTVKTVMTTPPTEQEMIMIENITEGSSWLVYPQQKQCSRVKSTDYPFHGPQCIPDDAVYGGSAVFGDKKFTIDSWVVPNVLKLDGFYSTTVDKDCIPNGDQIVGTMSSWGVTQQIVSTTKYFNFTRGIDDPDKYFKVPDLCKKRKTSGKGTLVL